MSSGNIKLAAQGTNWISPYQNTDSPGVPLQLNAYTGTWTTTAPTTASGVNSAAPYVVTDGIDGAIMLYVVENNVGAATLNIEGSFDNVNWAAIGYYTIVSNGTAEATLTRSVSTFAQTQNHFSVFQILDAFPLMRVRPSANTGSINAGFYLIPA